MDECAGRNKQSESKRDRKHQNPDERPCKKKRISYGGPLTKSAAEVSQISKAFDGNDRDGNDELDIKHPFSKSTDFYNLPLEILDVILQKSYLHWILNSSTKQRDEEIIRSLKSVDFCFNKRITRQRFKKAIWRYLKEFYGKTKKRHAIIRNIRNYLENNIKPSDELIASLLSLNCITAEQSHFIQRRRSKRHKNVDLLDVMQSFDERKFSTFVKCLRRTRQRTVAKIIEHGGGVIKIKVQIRDEKCTASMINDLRCRATCKPRSPETVKLIVQLLEEGLEILSYNSDGQAAVVWIWCHSQTAIDNLQRLYESNQLRDKYFENIQQPTCTSKAVNIDSQQFRKTVVVRAITIYVKHRFEMSENESTGGVIKLRNDMHVNFGTGYPGRYIRISVLEYRYPFRLQTDIKAEELNFPFYIASSQKENCLYIGDFNERCVRKIIRETKDQHKIIKWLTTVYKQRNLSMSRDNELLMIKHSSHRLMIYGSDQELTRSIPLTRHTYPQHAVETAIENFIFTHVHEEQEEDKEEDDKGVIEVEERKEKVDMKEEVTKEEGKHKGSLMIEASFNFEKRRLTIYGSDAELIRSNPLTRYIKQPWHAIETSIGNFIITYRQGNEKGEVEDDDEDDDKDEDEDDDEDDDNDEDEDDDEDDDKDEDETRMIT